MKGAFVGILGLAIWVGLLFSETGSTSLAREKKLIAKDCPFTLKALAQPGKKDLLAKLCSRVFQKETCQSVKGAPIFQLGLSLSVRWS